MAVAADRLRTRRGCAWRTRRQPAFAGHLPDAHQFPGPGRVFGPKRGAQERPPKARSPSKMGCRIYWRPPGKTNLLRRPRYRRRSRSSPTASSSTRCTPLEAAVPVSASHCAVTGRDRRQGSRPSARGSQAALSIKREARDAPAVPSRGRAFQFGSLPPQAHGVELQDRSGGGLHPHHQRSAWGPDGFLPSGSTKSA